VNTKRQIADLPAAGQTHGAVNGEVEVPRQGNGGLPAVAHQLRPADADAAEPGP
jgi:hypothetical protein